jgi:hypothetical protein
VQEQEKTAAESAEMATGEMIAATERRGGGGAGGGAEREIKK